LFGTRTRQSHARALALRRLNDIGRCRLRMIEHTYRQAPVTEG
jgi:hypothetical protein